MEVAGEEKTKKEEGNNLLGSPTFKELENGRFKCVETGHEMLAKEMDYYSRSKRCRLGLIDFSLSQNKPPFNFFNQDPLCRSKLKCKLTGDTVNKSEEHILKHINGKRFLNKLEQMEMEKLSSGEMIEEEGKQKLCEVSKPSTGGKKQQKKKKDKDIEEIISEVRNSSDKDSDSEEADLWVPPDGDDRDLDDTGNRLGAGSEHDSEEAEEIDGAIQEELSTRTKRMSIEIGPSSFASRKKKCKKNCSS